MSTIGMSSRATGLGFRRCRHVAVRVLDGRWPARGRAWVVLAFVALLPAAFGMPPPEAAADTRFGTFSIVARDSITGELGVAVQSRAFSVGAAVPWAEAGAGAVASQASTNESFGPRGLVLLTAGLDAGEAIAQLLHHDTDREHRQLAIVDATGRSAAHTGAACLDWAGHREGPGYSCQGNILAGAEVVAAMARAYETAEGELGLRLLAALEAGQEAGGDRRGQQSAALLVVRPSEQHPEYRTRYTDLRVEDHPEPIRELRRVYEIHEGGDLLRAHLRYADEYEARGDTARAANEREQVGRTLARVLERGADDANLLNSLAWHTALAEIHLDEALAAAERAVELEPENFEILDTLAEVHFRRGEIREAVAVGERALALDPESNYLREQLARFRAAETSR
jgi:uncharacterized Ntn-hydrolase superfamily protein